MQNFGNIHNAFNDILIEGIINKDILKKKKYQKYVKILKENEILKTQFLVYTNILNKVDKDTFKAYNYVSENINLISKYSLSDITKANKILINLLGEDEKYLKNDYENKTICNTINSLIKESKNSNPSNLDKILNAKSILAEHIVNNKEKEKISEGGVPNSVLLEVVINKFNQKYSDIDDETKEIIKKLGNLNEEEKINLFNESVNKCISLVENSNGDDSAIKEKLLEVKNKLIGMEYNSEMFPEQITKLLKLEDDLKD